ncbi:MAG TPA: hypothetical protein VGG75_37980 [Trebonia sp.]
MPATTTGKDMMAKKESKPACTVRGGTRPPQHPEMQHACDLDRGHDGQHHCQVCDARY